jgi:GNAT superfamily N-acetyltransferase
MVSPDGRRRGGFRQVGWRAVAVTAERLDRLAPPAGALDFLSAGWPEFIFHDAGTARYIGRVRQLFGDLELALVDAGTGAGSDVVAAGWGVPLRWDGTVGDLPAGYTDALRRALSLVDGGGSPDTFAILAAQVRPDRQRQGLATTLLGALRTVAREAGWSRVICPVRPTLKTRYPLTPIERFMTWTRPDGAPLDPWLRTHWRMGARVLAAAPRSQVVTGTVAQWEAWTGMALPDSGDYVIPGGLSPLTVDRAADSGVYVEPNVWLRHE